MNIRDGAVGVVVTPPSPALSGTTLTLRENDGGVMPDTPFYLTVAPPGELPSILVNAEKVLVTDVTNDTLTIEREQDESTAQEIAEGWIAANAIYAEDTLGKNNAHFNEPAIGDVDGSNTTFTVSAGTYVAGTLIVTVNGLVQKRTDHYTETTPGSGTFTMATAPETGDNVQVSYDASESARGNASTIEGLSLSDVYQAIYPVGSVYINATNSANPSTLLGFGTWAAFGAGRVLVGFNGSDSDFDTSEKTGGAKTHTLTEAEMPNHRHEGLFVGGTEVTWTANQGGSSGSRISSSASTTSVDTGFKGGGSAHNNLQPYITVYMWKRTA